MSNTNNHNKGEVLSEPLIDLVILTIGILEINKPLLLKDKKEYTISKSLEIMGKVYDNFFTVCDVFEDTIELDLLEEAYDKENGQYDGEEDDDVEIKCDTNDVADYIFLKGTLGVDREIFNNLYTFYEEKIRGTDLLKIFKKNIFETPYSNLKDVIERDRLASPFWLATSIRYFLEDLIVNVEKEILRLSKQNISNS